MKKNMTRYALCLSLLFCSTILLKSPFCMLRADSPENTIKAHLIIEKQSQLTNFFSQSIQTRPSLDKLFDALDFFFPNKFSDIKAQYSRDNSFLAEELITILLNNLMLLPVDSAQLIQNRSNTDLVMIVKESQAMEELKNFVSSDPRWKILPWAEFDSKLIRLFDGNPTYAHLMATLTSVKNSGAWMIKLKLWKHLNILPEELKNAGLEGLNRGLRSAGL